MWFVVRRFLCEKETKPSRTEPNAGDSQISVRVRGCACRFGCCRCLSPHLRSSAQKKRKMNNEMNIIIMNVDRTLARCHWRRRSRQTKRNQQKIQRQMILRMRLPSTHYHVTTKTTGSENAESQRQQRSCASTLNSICASFCIQSIIFLLSLLFAFRRSEVIDPKRKSICSAFGGISLALQNWLQTNENGMHCESFRFPFSVSDDARRWARHLIDAQISTNKSIFYLEQRPWPWLTSSNGFVERRLFLDGILIFWNIFSAFSYSYLFCWEFSTIFRNSRCALSSHQNLWLSYSLISWERRNKWMNDAIDKTVARQKFPFNAK